MILEIELKRQILEAKKRMEEQERALEEWKQKAWDIYWEYMKLCDRIIQEGIYFDRRKGNLEVVKTDVEGGGSAQIEKEEETKDNVQK